MAYNFVKLWTDALVDSWYISLTLAEKGLFTMLLLLCKNGADDGTVRGQTVAHLSALCTGNRKTVDRMLSIWARDGKIVWTKDAHFVQVTILNYKYWQGLKGGKYGKDERKDVCKTTTVCPPNSAIRVDSDKSRVDQIREDKNFSGSTARKLDPYEELRREDLTKVVQIISKWDCMRGVKNPYGIAGKLVNVYKHDPVFTCEVLRQKGDIFCLCKDASHLIASATATYQRASDIPEIESDAHKRI